ncbi:MAG: LLM class flavin-dependent oxidoreductase [Beijerinckiaceae bacterium]|nr:LLM class flavin-dependent oxidoreductase [Beijerinckiaceae bacterium]
MADKKQIKLGMFLRPAGHHLAAWRHPNAQADAGVNIARFIEVAKIAERGCFDMLFSADSATANSVFDENGLRRMAYVAWIEPFTLLAALASVTQHIGLVCTASTTFEEPFSLARKFASLDHVSHGRAGWNLVTSGNHTAALNFSRDEHMAKDQRYIRAREFAEVVMGLWDSWDDDAFERNRDSGIFFDPKKMHTLNHVGDHFKVKGPLNVARSPQGRPVLVQAGASEDGKSLAAETAEVVFTATPTIEEGRAFYSDLKSRMAAFGREPDELKIMPGFFVTVGDTQEEAHEKREVLQRLIHPEVGIALLSQRMGLDLSGFDVDGPLPDVPQDQVISSRVTLLMDMARRDNMTIRQLYTQIAGGRGHYDICGTPEHIADVMEEWFQTGAADGFNVMPPVFPDSLTDFVDKVVPELQRRGLFRTRYEGTTLRENLGLSRPASRYA